MSSLRTISLLAQHLVGQILQAEQNSNNSGYLAERLIRFNVVIPNQAGQSVLGHDNVKSCAGVFWLIRYSQGGITR
jgi:hypothetical protein